MRRAIRKLHNRKGFSLGEVLTAVLIMLMVSSIVAAGIPAAKNAYEKVVMASNAEVLLSTTVTALRNELGMADHIKVSGDGTITYDNLSTGASSRIFRNDEATVADPAGTIMLQRYAGTDELGKAGEAARLISKEASTVDLYVTYDAASYDADNHILTFTNLAVKRASTEGELALRPSLSLRILAG